MSKTLLVIGVTLAIFSATVSAGKCPSNLKYVDDNMMKNSVSPAEMKVVMALRVDAIKFHNAGDHGASVVALQTATKLLKLDPM